MSSIKRCRSGLMGLADIAKAPVSHGVEPHDLETGLRLSRSSSFFRPSSRRYRASGFVQGREAGLKSAPRERPEWSLSRHSIAPGEIAFTALSGNSLR